MITWSDFVWHIYLSSSGWHKKMKKKIAIDTKIYTDYTKITCYCKISLPNPHYCHMAMTKLNVKKTANKGHSACTGWICAIIPITLFFVKILGLVVVGCYLTEIY